MQYRRLLPIVVASAALSVICAGPAHTQQREPKVTFSLEGPRGFEVRGITDALHVKRDRQFLNFLVPMASLTTGLAGRDKEMRERYLEVAKYPQSELQLPIGAIRRPGAGAETAGRVSGSLRLHGRAKEVSVQYTVRRSGEKYLVRSSAQVDLRDFGIQVPTWLGASMKPEVQLSVVFQTDDKELK